MNKLLMLPLTVIIMLSVISILYSSTPTPLATFEGASSSGNITVDETTTNVSFESGNSESIDLTLVGAALIVLGLSIGLATAVGFHVLGTGISDTSQKLIFNSCIYLGLWGMFSVLSYPILLGVVVAGITLGLFIWMVLTITYVLGFTRTVQGA